MLTALILATDALAAAILAIVFLVHQNGKTQADKVKFRRQKRLAQIMVGKQASRIGELETALGLAEQERDDAHTNLQMLLQDDNTVVPIGKHATEKEAK